MAKEVTGSIKLQVAAGSANPSPPVGPALGQHGLNIKDFCQEFNDRTKDIEKGLPIPVIITVFKDRTFEFVTKTPPASVLIRKALGLDKGSSVPNREKVGTLTLEQVRQIAETKMPDLNTKNIKAAEKIIIGTAESMGVLIGGDE